MCLTMLSFNSYLDFKCLNLLIENENENVKLKKELIEKMKLHS